MLSRMPPLVQLAAVRSLACHLPKADGDFLREAEHMVGVSQARITFLVHENIRWYNTIREI